MTCWTRETGPSRRKNGGARPNCGVWICQARQVRALWSRVRKTFLEGISMASHIHNLSKVEISREGVQHLEDLLSASESHDYPGVNGSLQCAAKELLYPLPFAMKLLQSRQGQGRVWGLPKANDLVDEIKQLQHFTLTCLCAELGRLRLCWSV